MKSIFELFIGFRYLKSKKSQGIISFNTLLSVFIVFIGVFILIVVISVMNGFQSQIKDKILDIDSHITIQTYMNDDGITSYKRISKRLKNVPGVKSVVPFYQGQGIFRYMNYINPVLIRGVESESGVLPKDISKFIIKGQKTFNQKSEKEVFIGEEMAKNYHIRIGQQIELIVAKGKFGLRTGMKPAIGKFKVIGFFKTGYYEYDTKVVFMSLATSQKFHGIGNKVWGIGVKVDDVFQINSYVRELQKIAGYDYQVITAEEKNQNLFYALKLEKLIMTIILFLVIIAAGFTIMGTLVMVVMEKRKAIGILKSMGAGPNSIMLIFVLEGFLIGVIGTVAGVILGLAAAINLEDLILWIEYKINSIMSFIYNLFSLGEFEHVKIVPTNVYYIEKLPTEVNPEFVVFIAVFAVFLSTVSAIFPAWHASRLKPVETIRYE